MTEVEISGGPDGAQEISVGKSKSDEEIIDVKDMIQKECPKPCVPEEPKKILYKSLMNAEMTTMILSGHDGLVTCVETDGFYVVSAGEDSKINVWDASTGRCIQCLMGHADRITGLALLRTGKSQALASEIAGWMTDKILISVSIDGVLKTWMVHEGHELRSFSSDEGITCLRGFRDNLIVTGTDSGRLVIRTTSEFDPVSSVAAHIDAVMCLAVENHSIASADGEKGSYCLRVWKYSEGRLILMYSTTNNFNIQLERIQCLAMSRGVLFVGDKTSTLKLINWKNGGQVSTLPNNTEAGESTDALFTTDDLLISATYSSNDLISIINIRMMPNYEYVCSMRCDMSFILAIACAKSENDLKFIIGGSELFIIDFLLPDENKILDNTFEDSVIENITVEYVKELDKGASVFKNFARIPESDMTASDYAECAIVTEHIVDEKNTEECGLSKCDNIEGSSISDSKSLCTLL